MHEPAPELSVVAEVSPSTASVYLNRLKIAHLVKVFVQGKRATRKLSARRSGLYR